MRYKLTRWMIGAFWILLTPAWMVAFVVWVLVYELPIMIGEEWKEWLDELRS